MASCHMYHVSKGIKPNIPNVMLHHMISIAKFGNKKVVVPYGISSNKVFKYFKVPFRGEESTSTCQKIFWKMSIIWRLQMFKLLTKNFSFMKGHQKYPCWLWKTCLFTTCLNFHCSRTGSRKYFCAKFYPHPPLSNPPPPPQNISIPHVFSSSNDSYPSLKDFSFYYFYFLN